MRAPWEYWEEVDESVCVVDLEQQTVVYLNRCARAQLLSSSTEPYVGKPCYTLLQGRLSPCPTCTGPCWKVGRYLPHASHTMGWEKVREVEELQLQYQGRHYRVEWLPAQEGDAAQAEQRTGKAVESVLTDCIVQACSIAEPEEALERLLCHLGEAAECTHTGIYELRYGQELLECYSWPKSFREQPIPFDSASCPWEHLECCGETSFVITAEMLRQQAPELFRMLVPQPSDTMLLCPLYQKGTLCGFLRLDTVEKRTVTHTSEAWRIFSYFVASLLERRNLMDHFSYLGYHDQLTAALNRNALEEYRSSRLVQLPTGVIYCDINGLKQVNDQMGHAYGDRLIQRVYLVLQHSEGAKKVYRIGGDEFLMVFSDISQADFFQAVVKLRATIQAENCDVTVGCAWGDGKENFSQIQEKAEKEMYQAKQAYYRQKQKEGKAWRGQTKSGAPRTSDLVLDHPAPLRTFIKNYYFDLELFLNSIAMADTDIYLYCGDVQKNVYFISDNLKEDFGFEDNLVVDFIAKLEDRIYKKDRQMHIDDSHTMLEKKQTFHDIRYRIYQKNGELVWVHCRGIMKWNEDRSKALFFSGSMTGLKREAEIDTVSGFLSLSGAFQRIADHCQNNRESMFLCFTLSNFTDINQTYGHVVANQILWELGCACKRQLEQEYLFVRMDGLRFLALPDQIVDPGIAARSIRQVVRQVYEKHNIHIIYPCAIGVLRYPRDGTNLQTLMDRTVAVIRAAKAMPERPYVEFSPEMLDQDGMSKKMNLKLNASVGNGFEGFRIVIQPQVSADSGRIFGGEVLLRWQDQGEPISPGVFIPVLEQMGLIQAVGRWIIHQSVELCQRLLTIHPDFHLSFNVSSLQMVDQELFYFIEQLLEESGVSGRNLTIELTESHSDTLPKQLERFMEQCRGLGITFALDDFGSGYSGVQMLLQYPIDLVKFDRSMVKEITASQEKLEFIINTIQTCHRFHKKVCMEGVECEEELERVRQTKCDYIQGFYYYRPLELEDICKLLEQDRKRGEEHCERKDNAGKG